MKPGTFLFVGESTTDYPKMEMMFMFIGNFCLLQTNANK